jgi:uncharacterized protein YeaO (DUF488 family)
MSINWNIEVKCVHDLREPSDGRWVLVDRIWPRGLAKADADLDEWRRDVAPSTALRPWYGHCAQRFGEFRGRYLIELDDPAHAGALAHLHALTQNPLTLLTATKNLTTPGCWQNGWRGAPPSTGRGCSASTSATKETAGLSHQQEGIGYEW